MLPLPLVLVISSEPFYRSFPSFANSFARIVVPGRKESRLNRITETGGPPGPFPRRPGLDTVKVSRDRPIRGGRGGFRVPESREERRGGKSRPVEMLVTTISLEKKKHNARRGHNESGDTCVISFHRICCAILTLPRPISRRLSSLLERSQGHQEWRRGGRERERGREMGTR